MKKTLLSAGLLVASFGFSQNLMQNPTCDDHTSSTSDNADAYDMTPNNQIKDEMGVDVTSPYQTVWDNDDLEDWLEIFYLGTSGTLDEQPGSTSSGNNGTRGVKLYDDGSPAITGSSRRIYQKVINLTAGNSYTFSVDSRSEAMNTPSQVYLLNTEITEETGINANGSSDSSVDGYMEITNDFDAWTNNEVTFTASGDFVVVYIRSLGSIDGTTEVFYDNFSLVEETTASTDDVLASQFSVYPNPASSVVNISSEVELSSVALYSTLGSLVYSSSSTDSVDVSGLTKGVYFLKVTADGATATKKLIVE